MNISELNAEYQEADSIDKGIFAEQRSNVLLVAGDHYTKRYSNFWGRIREDSKISGDVRIRLTMNHTGRIVKRYSNSILSYSPGTSIKPKNQKELKDQKVAQINQKLWQDAKDRHDFDELRGEFADDFCEIGEVHGYIHWDPSAGPMRGYEQLVINGEPQFSVDELGNPVPVNDESKPVYAGDFVFDRLLGFNLLRNPEAQKFSKTKYLIYREMADIKELKKVYANDPEKLKFIQQSSEKTFKIFEVDGGGYRMSDETEVMIRTHVYRPSVLYPKGKFIICTDTGILEEGDLPFGEFPIISECMEKIQTSCRGRSIVKQIRPYQGEINRAASKQAEHQMTLGDDKLIVTGSMKVSDGGTLPGVRVVKVAPGSQPVVMEGRSGAQFVEYVNGKISEMYEIVDMQYLEVEKGENEPMALLFKSGKQRQKFARYTRRFQNFLIRFTRLYLRLAKHYIDEKMFEEIVGPDELVNFAEFKNSTDLSFQVVIESSNDDLEEKMGRQIVMNTILQYASAQLTPEMIGEVIKAMPYANVDKITSVLTLNSDTAENMILALDRGEQAQPSVYDDAPYMINRLTRRVRESDFKLLRPEIQQAYMQIIQEYDQIEAGKRRELQMAESQLIPMGGAKVKVDYYINPDPNNPTKTQRATVPAQSIEWLLEKLNMQGAMLTEQEMIPPEEQIKIAQQSGAMQPAQPEIM